MQHTWAGWRMQQSSPASSSQGILSLFGMLAGCLAVTTACVVFLRSHILLSRVVALELLHFMLLYSPVNFNVSFFFLKIFFLIYREDEAKHTMMRCIRWKINNQLDSIFLNPPSCSVVWLSTFFLKWVISWRIQRKHVRKRNIDERCS